MLKSRWMVVLGVLPLVGALAGLSGCNNQSPTGGVTETAASDITAPANNAQAARPDHMMHARGPAMLLGAALRNLDLSDAQKTTIQAQIDALKPSAADMANHQAARQAMADAVRTGKVDETALMARTAMPKVDETKVAQAINVLHDTLTPSQRKELVEKVTAKIDRMAAHEGGHDKAHEGHDITHGPLGHLLKGIDLSDAQQASIKDALAKIEPSEADRAAMKAKHDAFLTTMKDRLATFAADKFDATAFLKTPDGAPMPGPQAMVEHMVKVAAVVTPILNETQRAEVAKRIEAGPMGMAGHGHSHGPDADDE